MVLVRDMEIGKKYKKNDVVIGKLVEKNIAGYEGGGFQEPYYILKFEGKRGLCIIRSWDETFELLD